MMRALAIVGATASGKSALALALAERLGGEIVSCDSMQIYRGMDIGTAKPTRAEMERIPHHMIDIVEPSTEYSVADYAAGGRRAIRDILARGKVPIIVGGTGLYFDALRFERYTETPGEDSTIRQKWGAIAELPGGRERVHAYLAMIDPVSAAAIHPNNVRRVIRAIEIYELSGIPKSIHDARSRERMPIVHCLAYELCYTDRALLRSRMDARVDAMVEAGLIPEARALYEAGHLSSGTAGQAIGYRQLIPYFKGECPLPDALASIKTATAQYAKRQITWFRHAEGIARLEAEEGGVLRTTDDLLSELLPNIQAFFA